jgi:hypothetical protein
MTTATKTLIRKLSYARARVEFQAAQRKYLKDLKKNLPTAELTSVLKYPKAAAKSTYPKAAARVFASRGRC